MAMSNDTCSLPRQPVLTSIVDVLFPGFSNISPAGQQLQNGHMNSYTQILYIWGIAVLSIKYAYYYIEQFVDTHFAPTIHISETDEAYDIVLAWIYRQSFTRDAYSSLASVGARNRRFTDGHSDGNRRKVFLYSPWKGTFFFWYKNRLLRLRSIETVHQFVTKEDISLSCFGTSSKVIKDLLDKCRTEYLASVQNKISIFKHHHGTWNKEAAVQIRKPDTIIIDEEQKMALLNDTKSYLESRQWYYDQGIPYRRGYLLHGPHGTGKSSLSQIIAGACDLDMYILNLSTVDDASLDQLFNKLPLSCLVLLEDIDCVNTTHSRQRGAATLGQDRTTSTGENPKGGVSLSTLLNAIDGVASPEGRVLVMTTNYMERLDSALLRPGRVDMKMELGLTTRNINFGLFLRIFEGNKKLEARDEIELKAFAAEFARKVPEGVFSPADVQLYLTKYKDSPALAVQNVQELIGSSGLHLAGKAITRSDMSTASTTEDDLPTGETTLTKADVHCCACNVRKDIKAKFQAEVTPSVEDSLFFNYTSSLKDRDTQSHQDHSTKLFKVLQGFCRNTYRRHYPRSPSSQFSVSNGTSLETGSELSDQDASTVDELADPEVDDQFCQHTPPPSPEPSTSVQGGIAYPGPVPQNIKGGYGVCCGPF